MANKNEVTSRFKEIAFVAMPFGTKPTGLPPGATPARVDFDALWSRSIKPSLEQLGYRVIRADEQSGSVIIKDMLAQLVHADLVLVDISLPNGNVYYEAGIRHAAKAEGCVLINASWARPLFDLKQITQLRYEFATDTPTDADYSGVQERLVSGLPNLVNSTGPVFELVHTIGVPDSDSRALREQADSWYQFDTALKSAVIAANAGDRNPLRDLITPDKIFGLPAYAVKELVGAVRDNLNWGELRNLVDSLPDSIRDQAYFQEQKALALGKLGELPESIALLESVIDRYEPTPDRCGNIGGRYRDLARRSDGSLDRSTISKAINAFERGLELDLNDYYCAHKLLVSLVERGRCSDAARAEQCAIHVDIACKRAEKLNPTDEWLPPTRLILSVFRKDVDQSAQLLETVLDAGWSNWKLVGLLTDLKALFGLRWDDSLDIVTKEGSTDPTKRELLSMIKDLQSELPISQAELARKLNDTIMTQPIYKKFLQVEARVAKPGEVIVSVTSSGEETINTAGEDDVVIKNLTKAKEEYIAGAKKFHDRYIVEKPLTDDWQIYDPAGEVRATEITHDITTLLGVGNRFFIMAAWGEQQFASEGDYFVSPAPGYDEIYRIGRSEFDETYKLKSTE